MMQVGISLGFNCYAAEYGVSKGLRQQRTDGYKTCPFDLCLSSYDAMIDCIRDDFKDFLNPDYYKIVPSPTDNRPKIICHTKYKFLFYHESPTGRLYQTEKWAFGINHFVENNYERFITRYANRINNFREYMALPDACVTFLVSHDTDDTKQLECMLAEKYPNLNYKIEIVPVIAQNRHIFDSYHTWVNHKE